ncbi:MAG: hypothetical protein ACOC93_03545 [Planctomycetota bacterium]
MSKTLQMLMLMVAVVGLSATPMLARSSRGPADKATGGLVIEANNHARARVEFNAHEAHDEGGEAQGELRWYLLDDDGEVERTITVDVSVVQVEDSTAWFAGEAIEDSRDDRKVGNWLYVKATDGGSPAYENDTIGWKWVGSENNAQDAVDGKDSSVNNKPALEGNLVVHAK